MSQTEAIEAARPHRRSPFAYLEAAVLVSLMVLGSFMLWVGFPIGWLWIGSHLTDTTQPTLTPYVIVLAGFVVSVFVDYKLLVALNARYSRVMHVERVDVRLAWLRSFRDDRVRSLRMSVLDVVMIGTVSIALLAFVVWFFGFAGSSIGPAT